MIKIPCTIAACSLAMVGTSAFAQETVPVDEWAFTSNYAVNTATITGEDTNSPVIVNAAQSIGWAGKFPAMRLSEPDDSVLLSFDLTVDQSFGSGNTRFALTSSGSASGTRQGIPPIWTGSDFAGWRGYTFALAGGGNAPGANGGAAGTGTLVARNSGNWISTNGDDYSLLTDSPYLGPSTDADAGDYHGEIELYRVDASTIEVTITVNNADSSYLYTLASVLDTGAVASAITQVDTFAWGSTASTAATYTWSNVTVTGRPKRVSQTAWL